MKELIERLQGYAKAEDLHPDERATLLEAAAALEAAREDARLWRKHRDSFAVLLSVLDAASPLVLNKLRVEDAVKDAAASYKEEDADKNPVTVSITLGRGLCLGLTEEDHLVIQHMDSGQIQADLGEFSVHRAANLCEYIQRLSIHVQ